jgi:hypothetical protein
MSENVANVYTPEQIVNLYDQAILISLYIENRPFADSICARKSLTNIFQLSPARPLGNTKPRIKRTLEIAVPHNR